MDYAEVQKYAALYAFQDFLAAEHRRVALKSILFVEEQMARTASERDSKVLE